MAYKGSNKFNLYQDKKKRQEVFNQYKEDPIASKFDIKCKFDKIISVDLDRRGIKLKKSY